MRAVRFERPHYLNVVVAPLRRLREGEVLVKVEECGICGTDVHIVEGVSRSSPPVVLGHEYAGVVEECGTAVHGLVPGDRVAIDPNISCGTCYYCRRGLVHLCANLRALGVDIDGGMAEYSLVPAAQAYKLPKDMPRDLAPFVEPVSCAVHGIDRANIHAGDTVVIIGGGTIGLVMMQLARNAGAARILVLEPIEHKRAMARTLGADAVVDSGMAGTEKAVQEFVGVGADVVIDCTGKLETARSAIQYARRGGTVELFGVTPIGQTIPLEPNLVYFKELTIVGSYVNPNTFDRAITLLSSCRVRFDGFSITRYPLEGIHDALQAQAEGKTMKCIIQPHS
jgi:threonine dehydrogenase-like Zn-dependent dehydrogenase